ncbi:MAG: hypothetical protein COS41_01885 [Elusimicrobia bacterium CG03_land_8_20_14_0_80_50_18]|nr:MAG: hypothetical protein COS41_01885 [Elusimicrobia bacterium CG03_land_8_20_14_0_80_50_18]
MKILLINPPYIQFSGIKNSGGHAIPLNLAYLAGYLRKYLDCGIKVMDAETHEMDYSDIRRGIVDYQPDIVGISTPTPVFNHVAAIAKIIKNINPGIFVIAGGPHPSAFPEEAINTGFIDFAVRGEGELTFYELAAMIAGGCDDYGRIKGIAYKKNDKVILTGERELIEDIDSIPFPARDLFNLDSYYQAPTKKVSNFKSTSILTSRGCPYDCMHCISKLIWRRRVRYRGVKTVVDEIEECVKKYGIREFNFYDDTFTLNKKRVIDICRTITERKLDIAWICFGRINIIDKEMLEEMKKAGCRKISFGLESGSQKILDIMRKNTTVDMGRKAVKAASDAGLSVHASFMLGNIGETHETIRQTIDYAKELDLDNATFFLTTPFPGTDLYTEALKSGCLAGNLSWEDFAPLTKSNPILVQNNITQDELIAWQKRAFKEFYLRPKYLLRKLRSIHSLDDIRMMIEGLGVFFRLQKK